MRNKSVSFLVAFIVRVLRSDYKKHTGDRQQNVNRVVAVYHTNLPENKYNDM